MQLFIVSSLKFEVFPNALKFEYIYINYDNAQSTTDDARKGKPFFHYDFVETFWLSTVF